MDPLGDRPHVGEGAADVVLGAGDGRRGVVGRRADLVEGHPQLADQRRQLLLHAVVDVPLDAPPLRVLGLDDARPRGGDLDGLAFDLSQAGLELVGLADRPQAQRRLAAERAEQLAVVGVERAATLGAALEQPELLVVVDQGDPGGGRRRALRLDAGRGDDRCRA